MFAFLKNHPFPVAAWFDHSVVLTFAIPKEELEGLIPECLSLDTFENKWAFVAIAMVQTKELRPKGFPKFMGNDFFLIGYRIFVRYQNNAGKRLRGLYILKSATNKKKMEWLGSIFTQYKYETTDIEQRREGEKRIIKSNKSDFNLRFEIPEGEVPLPKQSPFSDWKTARRFAGPLPFTFTYKANKNKVLIIQGLRQNWKPKPIQVLDYHFSFINQLGFKNALLANSFIIENIPYSWKKGKTETWKK